MRQNEKSNEEEGRDVQIVKYVCGKQTYAHMKGTRQMKRLTFFFASAPKSSLRSLRHGPEELAKHAKRKEFVIKIGRIKKMVQKFNFRTSRVLAEINPGDVERARCSHKPLNFCNDGIQKEGRDPYILKTRGHANSFFAAIKHVF